MHLQKICDVSDWNDPGLAAIIRDRLITPITLHPKQWEQAIIYGALRRSGALRGRGLGFGTGVERLIYVFARDSEGVVATDLYGPDTNWRGAKTEDPQSLVMSRLPFPVPEEKISVERMDMRELSFADDSFDFAWSTCAFEHIGFDEDYIRHLNEVHRVLKPGGRYVFTTALAFEDKTYAAKGLHFFTPRHLLGLVGETPFHAQPIFDCGLAPMLLNRPTPMSPSDYGVSFENGNVWPSAINILRQGMVTTQCSLVLAKRSGSPSTPKVIGWESAREFISDAVEDITRQMWDGWQYLKPIHSESGFHTTPQYFGSDRVVFKVQLPIERDRKISLAVVSLPRATWPAKPSIVETTVQTDSPVTELSVETNRDRCYFVRSGALGQSQIENASVFARRVP